MSISPLCKITFCVNQQQKDKQQTRIQQKPLNFIQVFPGVTTRQLAQSIGRELGCGYQDIIEQEIRSELMKILKDGNGINKDLSQEQVWRFEMEKILGFSHHFDQHTNSNKMVHENSEKNLKNKYFSNKYDKIFKNQSQKFIGIHNKENLNNIYDRAMAKRKQKQEKISMIKKTKEKNEIIQCTFTPNIKDTEEFFNKNRPNFFNQEERQKDKENTFQRLYKQSFDLKQKRNKRLRTLENQQEAMLSQLSFAPVINQCSREICKMKSYASFIQEFEDEAEKPKEKIKINQIQYKPISKENTVKKNKQLQCTFQPEISQNTKRLTQNLPNFYDRLQMSKEKKKIKEAQHNQSINSTKPGQKSKKINKVIIKKQLYTIDDGTQLPTEKKTVHRTNSTTKSNQKRSLCFNEISNIEQNCLVGHFQEDKIPVLGKSRQKRSQQLFNNRKKNILETIVSYFTVKPYVKEDEFSKKHKKLNTASGDVEINTIDIEKNRYIPNFVKELLEPITSELKEAEISLSKRQFLWAMEKLFEGLDISDKGMLLGWGVKLLPQ